METPSQAHDRMSGVGFTADLVVEGSVLRDPESGQTYQPSELRIAELVRSEAVTEPGDEATVYALATPAGEPVGTWTMPDGHGADKDEATIASMLRPLPFSDEEIQAHQAHDHVAAVFADRQDAERAVDELRDLGLGSDRLGVAIRGEQPVAFEIDAERDLGRDAGRGVGLGAVGGFLAGFALFGLAVPPLGIVGVGGLFALSAATGVGGAMLGGYLGVATGEQALSIHEAIEATPLGPQEVIVAVCSHGHPDEVERVMQHNGGRVIATPST